MNLSRCPKEFNKFERRYWKFYLPVVIKHGLMNVGAYTSLKELCIIEGRLENLNHRIRESEYGFIFSEKKWCDYNGVEQTGFALSPIIKQINTDEKEKRAYKKVLGLDTLPAEKTTTTKMEGMLDG